ncbi:MAG TPA: hypothetical protein PLA02_11085 [Brevefilum fermentans]|jgi:hypothetical protein|uniref:Uncharacterized protein n=1 Tax=Candidatus Brevifilum fermentans TaxID=1986204 RepID=A0A1Y6K1Z1_9CHLR|nr:hypothetical protein [Brevefilum fermentans]OQB87579.1 MAG: hypothetical protein BWX85_00245 [Chloroflexi bacterium ADurb.Bin120]SMX53712.1 protein of unknown function [Brevefilum fermentans]HPX96231.1 hypothetical protein [Brevefilum fermentans]HQA29745.1 hypothetical protein [Brevefilum fermentans]
MWKGNTTLVEGDEEVLATTKTLPAGETDFNFICLSEVPLMTDIGDEYSSLLGKSGI